MPVKCEDCRCVEGAEKALAYVVFNLSLFVQAVWRFVKPYLQPVLRIYGTIDFGNLDFLYVLVCFVKAYLMVMMYCWQCVRWAANMVVRYTPGLSSLLQELVETLEHMNSKHRFLLRPVADGLFGRGDNY